MRSIAAFVLRRTFWLMIVPCVAVPACAREKAFMPAAAPAQIVSPQQVFADAAAARLAEAIASGDIANVRLLAAKTDLSVRGDKDVTLLHWALLNRQPQSMRVLLEAGADPAQPGVDGDTVLHLAAMANDVTYLELLLQHGASANAVNPQSGANALRSALMGERPQQFQMLLKAGANPNHADQLGNTPLHVAGQVNEPERALELLRAGADPAARNAQGVTFQRYLFMTKSALLNAETRRQREAVEAWLREHRIPLENAGS